MKHVPGRVEAKVALVTGAGSGIGRAAAELLAAEGARVACADINVQAAEETALGIRDRSGQAISVPLDVTDEEAWDTAMSQVTDEFGRLDILVAAAGISFAAPVAEMSLADWRRVLAVNLDGIFLGTRTAVRKMALAGGGTIVNISSASGIRAAANASAYSASKAAVSMFSKAVAKECTATGNGIRVNTVSPAGVKTPMWSTMPFFQQMARELGSEEAAYRQIAGTGAGDRFAEAGEIARVVLFLASDESSYVQGCDLVVDNGYTA